MNTSHPVLFRSASYAVMTTLRRLPVLGMVLLLAALSACDEESPVAAESPSLVVQAYLYAGENVRDIRLSTTLPLGSSDSIAPPVDDARVTLIKNGQSYPLISTGNGLYASAGADPVVAAGDHFDLDIVWGTRHITSSTVVPDAPAGVTLAPDTLWIPTSASMTYLRSDSARTRVTWTQAEGALWYVTAANIETDPEAIVLGSEPLRQARGRFITPPIGGSAYTLSILNLSHYGRHTVTVYRINTEYAALYLSREQNSRDLNEPATNIVNGLGVFTAFNGVQRQLVVAKR